MIAVRVRVRLWVLRAEVWAQARLARLREWAARDLNRIATLPAARLETCKSCPFYTAHKRCTACGCFMPAKVQFEQAKCPKGKW